MFVCRAPWGRGLSAAARHKGYAHRVTDSPNRALADITDLVARHGWAIRHVLADPEAGRAGFSYTVGLTSRGWPELIITGLPSAVADVFIRNAVDVQLEKGPFRAGDRTEELTEEGDVVFLPVDDVSGMTATAEIVGVFTALQLVWPDSTGHFPWQNGYRNPSTAQPLLGAAPR